MSTFAQSILRLFCKEPASVPASTDESEWTTETALNILRRVDPGFNQRVQGRSVVDFGSGMGFQSAALLKAGAARVLGIEPLAERIAAAQKLLANLGLEKRAEFRAAIDESSKAGFDLVISQNAMEHYSDPEKSLAQIRSLLKEGGQALITFGPPWYAPYGAHMRFFTALPWVQLLFSERTILEVRKSYRNDGAKSYAEIVGGLNRMSIRKFEALIARAGFTVKEKRYECVKGMNVFGKIPLLRELFINHVTALLERR